MWEEDVVWHISCSLEGEVLYDVLDWEHIGFNLVIINTDVIDRIITITAASYSNPSVYTAIMITVDPNRANFRDSGAHEGRLLGGDLSALTVPIIFINVPDGTYAASLSTSPIYEYYSLPMAHDFSGIRIEGWQTQDLDAVGYITVVDSIGRITFTSYDTPASHLSYWTWMTLEVDMVEFGIASAVIQIEFAATLEPPPPLAIVEIEILHGNFTVLPGFGSILTPVSAIDALGREIWGSGTDTFIWFADGLDEGDYLHWDQAGLNHFVHIGESQRERLITITASYANNPAIYDSFEITVRPYFAQKASEISFLHPRWGIFDEIVRIVLPANSSVWTSALAFDQYGLEMPIDDLIWTIDREVDADIFTMFSNGFILYIGEEELEREITITAASPCNPEIYAAFIVSVNPSLPTLGILEVLSREGTLTSGRVESTVITLSIPYLPDGTYRAMLSIADSRLRWETTNASFQNGPALPWGDITFKDGIADITLSSGHSTLAGEWELWLTLSLPEELRDKYFLSTPFVFFTLAAGNPMDQDNDWHIPEDIPSNYIDSKEFENLLRSLLKLKLYRFAVVKLA